MQKIKILIKRIFNRFSPFVSSKPVLKTILLFLLKITPKTKDKLISYRHNMVRILRNRCFFEYGFNGINVSGAWSISSDSKIIFINRKDMGRNLKINIIGTFYSDHYFAEIFVNNEPFTVWKNCKSISLNIPRKLLRNKENMEMMVRIRGISSLIGNSDKKGFVSGLLVKEIKVDGIVQDISAGFELTKTARNFYTFISRKIEDKRENLCASF